MTATSKVMIIDDEVIICKVIGEVLKAANYQTVEFQNGYDALSCFQESKDDVDLVVLDLKMPDIDGYQVLEQLKKIKPNVKVLIVSGALPVEKNELDELTSDTVNCLAKPFNILKFLDKVNQLVRPKESDIKQLSGSVSMDRIGRLNVA
jgi:DNA-binding response OmpR family regulator